MKLTQRQRSEHMHLLNLWNKHSRKWLEGKISSGHWSSARSMLKARALDAGLESLNAYFKRESLWLSDPGYAAL